MPFICERNFVVPIRESRKAFCLSKKLCDDSVYDILCGDINCGLSDHICGLLRIDVEKIIRFRVFKCCLCIRFLEFFERMYISF